MTDAVRDGIDELFTEKARVTLMSDSGFYFTWTDRCEELRKDTKRDGPSSEYWTERESVRFGLAEELKEWAEEGNPIYDNDRWSDFYTSIFTCALAWVNWQTIADGFVEANEYMEAGVIK